MRRRGAVTMSSRTNNAPTRHCAKLTLAFDSYSYFSRDGKSADLFYVALPPLHRPNGSR